MELKKLDLTGSFVSFTTVRRRMLREKKNELEKLSESESLISVNAVRVSWSETDRR